MRSPKEAFAVYYASMPDEELLQVAANLESLVPVAQAVLVAELAKRGKHGFAVPAPKSEPRVSGRWWPLISDEKSAKEAAAIGAGCAYVVAGITGVFAIISIFRPLSFVKPLSLVDALLFGFLGFMIQWKTSRIAAVAALIVFVGERIEAGGERGGGAAVWVLAVIFLLGFISGVRGAFAYHVYRRGLDMGSTEIKSF
ncbi:MAG: hypothetical protein ABSG25_09570 [Bryobacteraceae bacterium]